MLLLDHVVTHLESKKRLTKAQSPVWRARDLMPILGYVEWENFKHSIEAAITSCNQSGMDVFNHFREATTMVKIGSGATRQVEDWVLSKHACYLIAMNSSSTKAEVATAQAYFSIQAHKQEMFEGLTVEHQRLILRNRLKDSNQTLNDAAFQSGVKNFGKFHDAGYKGLYKMGKADVEKHKELTDGDDLLDCIGATELAANNFRATQTRDKLKRDNVVGEDHATTTHYKVGATVRKAIEDVGGTMPEDLRPEPSIKKLASRHAREIKKLMKPHE
jgi:DNA-damage-inducible protein D